MRAVSDPAKPASGLNPEAVAEISKGLTAILADPFALYVKTKNFHWHLSGAHFRDYHLLLDEQSAQILATTDPIAERVRKIGGTTLRSIGQIARLQRAADNDNDTVGAQDMLAELLADNQRLTGESPQCALALRRISRHRVGQPDRGLDRRGGTPCVVPGRNGKMRTAM